jgi:glutamate-1-semialdehyde 2,1-aminomutase
MQEIGSEVAAIIVEPVAGNMNMIPATTEFLQKIKELTLKYEAVLIFDEVMSGFRVALGGAQQIYKIHPDLVCLGKVIGAGLPMGAFGGKKEIMDCLAPDGDVYQAGTLSGNPIAVSAGIFVLNKIINTTGFYDSLQKRSTELTTGLKTISETFGIELSTSNIGGMFGIHFSKEAPKNFTESKLSSENNFKIFFSSMLKNGFYMAPSMFEAGFISFKHSEDDIKHFLRCSKKVFEENIKTFVQH